MPRVELLLSVVPALLGLDALAGRNAAGRGSPGRGWA